VLAVLPGMMSAKPAHLDFRFGSSNSPIPYNATYAATKAFANNVGESFAWRTAQNRCGT